MTKILYILKKEFLVMGRDIHSLAVLFIMPVAFILIMSLAMRDLFDTHAVNQIKILVVNQDKSDQSRAFIKTLENLGIFSFHHLADGTGFDLIRHKMFQDDFKFALVVEKDFSLAANRNASNKAGRQMILLVKPSVNRQTYTILKNTFAASLAKTRAAVLIKGQEEMLGYAGIDIDKMMQPADDLIETRYVSKSKLKFKVPTSVQQSVPAWLVFSMFFVVIPISNTFIAERNYGTLLRLQSINISTGLLLAGKLLPFFIVNLIQVVLMILVGVYVVPLLGGDALTMGDSYGGLLFITTAVSFCSISFALLVASVAKTTEHATTIGGVFNIILGALGGIMIPKFVMPEFMQTLSVLSPMSWGLAGFLDIFLRNGNILDVMKESLLLFFLGLVMLSTTTIIIKRKLSL
ncbi:MAG: ABC transporter permease [bacterium]|nr:ABC transporter permease [bacterium]